MSLAFAWPSPSLRGARRGRERAHLEAALEIVWHVRPWPATPQPERSTAQPEKRTTQQSTSLRASADVAPPFGSARREARSEVKASTTWLSRDAAMVYALLSIGAADTCQHAQHRASTASGQSHTGGGMRTRATHRPLETEAARASVGVAPPARLFAPRGRPNVPAQPRRAFIMMRVRYAPAPQTTLSCSCPTGPSRRRC